ncbi:MAG TPA: amino acid adenylation domain-containing protein [Methylomirabilota bacterium]|nr:amino acid adenylation domain-containing protein [Methylomirabilota bacterium]
MSALTSPIIEETVGPLSYSQQRLWFLTQLEPKNPTYNVPFALKLTGSLDVTRLQEALQQLAERHETLRTSFRSQAGAPVQVIAPAASIKLPILDLSDAGAEQIAEELPRLIEEEARTPFDVTRAPLMRTRLIQVNSKENILLVTLHHLVFDGWSVGIFFKELLALYKDGPSAHLPELEIQYLDYASWERETLDKERIAALVGYWKQELQGAPALLELPTDRPRPKVQSNHGRCESLQLPEKLHAELKSFCKREGVTPYMVGMAAFQALLHRYSGQDDIVVGSPIANRTQAQTEPLIGFFANTVLARGRFHNTLTFRQLVAQVKESTIKAQAHQEVPFDKLVEEIQPERNLSYNPIFQVMLSVYETPSAGEGGGVNFDFIDVETVTSKFDLTLFLITSGNSLTARFEYATDLFEAQSIRRMLGHFETLLKSALATPDEAVQQLQLLTAAEERQIVQQWNDTTVDYKAPQLVHELVERHAAATPNAVALRFNGQSMTYAEMNARANQLAHLLRANGVKPDSFVAVCMERSFEMVLALVAAMKAGGAYVPIDPSNPADRISFTVQDAEAPVLLTQSHLLTKLPVTGARVIAVDQSAELKAQPTTNPAVPLTPQNLCYTIYTSGSTGTPKGAMNTHVGVANRLLWGQATYNLTAEDRVLQKTPFSFDVSAWEFFWPLTSGAQLVIAPPGLHRDPAGIADLVNREGITIIHFVPSMLQAFVDEARARTCKTIRKTFCSGEALPAPLQNRFFSILPQSELHNLYGPTEASIEVTYWECKPDPNATAVPIGYPIANARLYVLDKQMRPVPVNVPGELHIGGIPVARGYHKRPELTKDRFVPNPFVPGETLYKTGDLCCFRADGRIDYLGRLDHQIKIRGFRIELGEIETIIASHPDVRETVVVARQENGDNRLAAYCVPKNGRSISIDELKERLRAKVPEYMVPSAFVILDKLPLNSNGKVDRKALPAPVFTSDDTHYRAPQSEEEQKLARIWCEVLNLEKVGVGDNFFDLGGHSLLAMQVISRVRTTFGAELPLMTFFQEPTLEAMSSYISRAESVSPTSQIKRTVSIAAPEPDVANLSDEEVERLLSELSKG